MRPMHRVVRSRKVFLQKTMLAQRKVMKKDPFTAVRIEINVEFCGIYRRSCLFTICINISIEGGKVGLFEVLLLS